MEQPLPGTTPEWCQSCGRQERNMAGTPGPKASAQKKYTSFLPAHQQLHKSQAHQPLSGRGTEDAWMVIPPPWSPFSSSAPLKTHYLLSGNASHSISTISLSAAVSSVPSAQSSFKETKVTGAFSTLGHTSQPFQLSPA